MMKYTRYRGFTIWQLLAVLGALFLLAAILFPFFARPRDTGHKASCQSNLKQIALGFFQYTQDYNERFPPAGKLSNGVDSGWARQLQPYTKSLQLFVCPQDSFVPDGKIQSVRSTNYYFNRNLSQKGQVQVKEPSSTILTGDGQIASSNYSCSSFDLCIGLNDDGPIGPVPNEGKARHLEGANYAFADGHVKWFKPEKVTVHATVNSSIYFALK